MNTRNVILFDFNSQIVQQVEDAIPISHSIIHLSTSEGVKTLSPSIHVDLVLIAINSMRCELRDLVSHLGRTFPLVPCIGLFTEDWFDDRYLILDQGFYAVCAMPIQRGLLKGVLGSRQDYILEKGRGLSTKHKFWGSSSVVIGYRALLKLHGESDESVLITGETGTGKEVSARCIHEASSRASHPFIAINCSAIPEGLFESELFGCVRGAFTGAMDRNGYCMEANGGTLFLDEIGELPIAQQTKLLRFLESGEIQKVGTTKTTKSNVRVIAATNRDLTKDVPTGIFRSDLYYRLAVLKVGVPSLRSHPEDIPGYVYAILEHLSQKGIPRPMRGCSEEVMLALQTHNWPGNFRELQNLIKRLYFYCDQPIAHLGMLAKVMDLQN